MIGVDASFCDMPKKFHNQASISAANAVGFYHNA